MDNFESIITRSGVKNYEKDAVILPKGDRGEAMYIILKGSVCVYRNFRLPGEYRKVILKRGDFFGEMSLFIKKRNLETIVALDDVAVLRLDRKNVIEMFKSQPEFTFSMITSLCARISAVVDLFESESKKLNLDDEPGPIPAETPDVSDAAPANPRNAPGTSVGDDGGRPADGSLPAQETSAPAPSDPNGAASQEMETSDPGGILLFPEGHDSYALPIDNSLDEYLFGKSVKCPACAHDFKKISVKQYKLVTERVDPDMRVHYKDVEPLHYEIITCPECWYSALSNNFASGKPNKNLLAEALLPHRSEFILRSGADRDTFTVFAEHYLALECAPLSFRNSQLITGRLWNKLRQLYSDCGDDRMEKYAAGKSLEDYMYAYERIQISTDQTTQILLILGELNYVLGSYADARQFFFKAKTYPSTSRVLRQQAENRIEDIRALLYNAEDDECDGAGG